MVSYNQCTFERQNKTATMIERHGKENRKLFTLAQEGTAMVDKMLIFLQSDKFVATFYGIRCSCCNHNFLQGLTMIRHLIEDSLLVAAFWFSLVSIIEVLR